MSADPSRRRRGEGGCLPGDEFHCAASSQVRGFLLFFALGFAGGARAADRLTIAWTSVAGSRAPLWITKEAGHFAQNGIDSYVIYIDGGSKATQVLLGDGVPLGEIGGDSTMVEGIPTYETKREFSIQVISRHIGVKDREALEDSYSFSRLVPHKPCPTLKGVKAAPAERSAKNPRARTAKPEDFVDMQFVREPDQSGFIDRLYQGRK